MCLNEGETIYFSDCNGISDSDYHCDETRCTNICVNEISNGVFCPTNSNNCDGTCEYLSDEPEEPVINPPVEDSTRVILVNPADDYALTIAGKVNFYFKTIQVSEQKTRFATCELIINGEVGGSKSTPQFNQEYSLSKSLTNGTYSWRIYCTENEDIDNGDVIMSQQRTITVGTVVSPVCGNNAKEGTEECDDGNTASGDGCSSSCETEEAEEQTEISLTSPTADYSSTGTQTLDFTFSISSSILSDISSCSLMLNDASVSTLSTISAQNTISYSISPATYTWRIDCLDDLSQTTSSITRTLTINTAATTDTGSSGGGGGGGGGGSSSITTYTLSQEELTNGATKSLAKLSRFKFKISNEDHYATLNDIKTNYVQITVSSEPQQFLLYTANEKKVDVDNNGVYDILITLNKIDGTKAEIAIKAISEIVTNEAQENSETTETTESNSEISQNKISGLTGSVIGGIKNNKLPIAIGFIIIIALAGVFSYNYKRKK